MKKSKSIFILLFLVLLFAAVILLLRNAGTYLVKTGPPYRADALVLLMGSIPDRVLETSDLYNKGIARKLIIVEESMGPYRQLMARGAKILSNTQQCRDACIQLGIPADNIVILPGDACSTQHEAVIIRQYLKTRPGLDTLILVSSSAHTRRAGMIFESAFNKVDMPVVVFCSPSKYTGFTGKGWWKNKEGIQAVVSEYVKMINFWLFDKAEL